MKWLMIVCLLLMVSFSLTADDYQRFEENGKIGLKDNTGKVVLPAAFDALGWSDGNFSVIGRTTGYRKQNRWGLLTLNKEFITEAKYESLTWSSGDRVIVSKYINPYTVKYGCLDLHGKLVIPFNYDHITLHGLRAIVMVKNGLNYEHGLIDLDDRSILPVRYRKIVPIGSLRYSVENFSGKNALSTEEGKWITDFVIDRIGEFNFDLAVIHEDWKQGIIDRNGTIRLEPIYREVKITGPGHVEVRKPDTWNILDENFKERKTLNADQIIFGNEGWNRVIIDGKYGLTDTELNPRWQLEYDFLSEVKNNHVIAKKNGQYGLMKTDQSVILPFVFDSLCVEENFIRARQTVLGKSSWSVYDTFGIKKTLNSYEFLEPYNGKFFPVKSRGYWGGVDRYGKMRIACVYDSLLELKDDLITVRFRGQFGVLTLEDQWKVLPQANRIRLLNEGTYVTKRDALLYLNDLLGNALYFTDNPVDIFSDHLVERLPDGTLKTINLQGQIVKRVEPLRAEQVFRESEGLKGIKRDGKFGFVDSHGRLRIANRYDDIGEFHDGLAPVKLLGKWGYINTGDQIVIQPTFNQVENFYNRVAPVARKDKWGLIDDKGDVLLELRYDSVKRTDDLFLITLENRKGLVNHRGRMLIEPRFEQLQPLNNKTVLIGRDGKFGVLTHDGLSVVPQLYDRLYYDKRYNGYLALKRSQWVNMDL